MAATSDAESGRIDSLDFLIASITTIEVRSLLARLGASTDAIRIAALRARPRREPGPGLSDDAKVVVETAVSRALEIGTNPDIPDLLVALVVSDCLARPVLAAHGTLADRLLELVSDE